MEIQPSAARAVERPHRLVQSGDGTFSASVPVPTVLQRVLGAEHIRKDLGTRDHGEAKLLVPFVALDISMALEDLANEQNDSALSDGKSENFLQIRSAKQKVRKLSREAMIAKILSASRPHRIHYETPYDLEAPDTRNLIRAADELILDFGIKLSRHTSGYWRLCARLDRLRQGLLVPPSHPVVGNMSQRDSVLSAVNTSPQADLTLFELVTRFDQEMSDAWSTTRRAHYEATYTILLKILKAETSVRSLRRADFKRARSIMEDLTPNWSKKPNLSMLPIEEAAKRCRELSLPRRKSQTVNHFIRTFKQIMDFAVAEGSADRNHVAMLLRRVPVSETRVTRPFTLHQLTLVFHSSPIFDQSLPVEQRTVMFWLPLIALWAGLRLSEAAQLNTDDIAFVDRVPVFLIRPLSSDNPAFANFVKTGAAVRVIPIHPALQRLGLLDYWRHSRERQSIKLFFNVSRKGMGYTYGWVSYRINLIVHKTLGTSRGNTFRSLRHNFRDSMRDAETPTDRAGFLGGWTGRSSPERYGIGGSIPRLYEEIKKLTYPGLDLSHLELYQSEADAMRAIENAITQTGYLAAS